MAAPLLLGAVLGAAATYLLDPDQGRRRRALLREQLSSRTYQLSDSLGVGGRDLSNRARGMVFGLRSRFNVGDIPDEILVARVRSRLGRVTSHPGAIGVTATHGQVVLSGPIIAREHEGLINAVCAVPGVVEVNDQLEVHESGEGVPALQGGGSSPETEHNMFMQGNWTPAARMLAGTAGGLLLLNALQKRGIASLLMGLAGSALLVRSSTNTSLRQLAGMSGHRAIDVHKTIHVSAPVEQVFDVLAHYENFPQFMTNVREVRVREDGSSHWIVAGPGGMPVEWDAVTTRMEPNRLLAWRTLPNSTVQHAGLIHFEPSNGGTRVDIQMSYNPPAGALGHAVAQIFRSDAKTELDEDLMRLKVFLETGKPARDAAAAVRH
jgi:uncharacterized membrane protein